MLTSKTAAEALGVSPGTVRRPADAGELPYSLTHRGHRRFNEADVLAYRVARAEVWRAAALVLLTEAQAVPVSPQVLHRAPRRVS